MGLRPSAKFKSSQGCIKCSCPMSQGEAQRLKRQNVGLLTSDHGENKIPQQVSVYAGKCPKTSAADTHREQRTMMGQIP